MGPRLATPKGQWALLHLPFLQSGALAAVFYSRKRLSLRVTFRSSGRSCVYDAVTPKGVRRPYGRPSKGTWFNTRIRDHHSFHEV